MTTNRTLGAAIRALRIERGMSIRDLAQHLGACGTSVHEATLSNVERGNRNASPALGAAIAAVLGVEVSRITRIPGCVCQQDRVAA